MKTTKGNSVETAYARSAITTLPGVDFCDEGGVVKSQQYFQAMGGLC